MLWGRESFVENRNKQTPVQAGQQFLTPVMGTNVSQLVRMCSGCDTKLGPKTSWYFAIKFEFCMGNRAAASG